MAVVGHGADERHRAAGQDLAGIGRDGAGFGYGLFDFVVREGADQTRAEVGIELTDTLIQFRERRHVDGMCVLISFALRLLSRYLGELPKQTVSGSFHIGSGAGGGVTPKTVHTREFRL